MNNSVQTISIVHLAIAFVPALVFVAVLVRWSTGVRDAVTALLRMLVQLLLIGYVLAYVFEAKTPTVIVVVLAVMITAAAWIALRPLPGRRTDLYLKVAGALALAGGGTLILVTQGVLQLEPWFLPRYVVPLAGMIFANSMNTVSLAAERFHAEELAGKDYVDARETALRAAMIPTINSLLAVGLVSLPGMMTGQILSGVSPLIAARYQIVVMCMIFGASGLSSALYLAWARPVRSA